MKKAISIIATVLVTIIVIFAVLMTAMVIVSTKSESGMPNLFGKSIFFVKTDSMQGPNGFNLGDLIVVDLLTEEEAENLKVGDVITFWRIYNGEKFLETHRIVEDVYTASQKEVVDGVWIHNGNSYYVTRGDNTIDIDYVADLSNPDYASADNIVGKWTGVAIPKVGSALNFLQQPTGFMICVVIPMAVFFFYEMYRFITTLNDKKKQSAVDAVNEAEEEIKAKAIAEYLAQQQAQGNAPAPAPAPAQPEPPKQKTEEELKQEAVAEYLAQQQAAQAKPKTEEEIKQAAVAEYLAQQQAAQAKPKTEEEIKQAAVAEYLAQQQAAQAKPKTEEEIKQAAIAEYLAKQAAETADK